MVYGFWALAAFTKPASGIFWHIADTLGTLPVFSSIFGGPVNGACFMTAGLILAIMVTPIITSLSREVLLTVPQDDKNAALAMGATRWEMLRASVFPRVRSGLIGAVMLGLGRAMGETIAVALVIGSSHQITSHLFRTGDTMASVIAHNFGEAFGLQRGRAHRARRGAVRAHDRDQRARSCRSRIAPMRRERTAMTSHRSSLDPRTWRLTEAAFHRPSARPRG